MPMEKEIPKIVVVAGPTASGKTAFSIELAEAFDGEIVSADSIQIYRYMDVGSAKPTLSERTRVRHHMIDVHDPDELFSAGDYVQEARNCITDILGRRKVPFVTGGTGLYIRCLLRGIVDLPATDPHARRALLQEEERGGKGTLFERLRELDPASAARTGPDNLPRIARALEVFQLTGRTMSELLGAHSFEEHPYDHLFICLSPNRSRLYERIDNRVDCMIKGGLLEEVARLREMGYAGNLKPMQSLGYRHAAMILDGEMAREESVRLMKRDTRRYAKRQLTWFRAEPDVLWCDPEEIEGIGLKVGDFLGP
jgi:tRNA dimethylallyltransferase